MADQWWRRLGGTQTFKTERCETMAWRVTLLAMLCLAVVVGILSGWLGAAAIFVVITFQVQRLPQEERRRILGARPARRP